MVERTHLLVERLVDQWLRLREGRLLGYPALRVDGIDQGLHHPRVELVARAPEKLSEGLLDAAGSPVGASRGHGVEGVGNGDDPGELRDVLACQSHRVAATVQALVVVPDAGDRLVEELELADDLDALPGVPLD